MAMAAGTKPRAKFGRKIKGYRETAGLTQAELATRVDITREYLASIEIGRIGVVYPKVFVGLRRHLGFPGWELLEEMGYPTDAVRPEDAAINPKVLDILRRMSPEQQQHFLGMLEAFGRMTPTTPPETMVDSIYGMFKREGQAGPPEGAAEERRAWRRAHAEEEAAKYGIEPQP